ncbi:MAG: hypothetical protein FJ276_28400, partial [Planctomycetes bacterium]|nr:hypothetical protein [Planctomycetota bacterium]
MRAVPRSGRWVRACLVTVVLLGPFCGGTGWSQAQDLRQFVNQLVLPAAATREQVDANRDRAVAVAFSPTGRYLVVGLESGHLAVWNLAAKKLQFTRQAHDRPVKLLSFGAEDRHMLTAADDLQVRLWDLEEERALVDYEGAPLRAMYEVALSSNARFALARGFDGFGTLWDLRTNRKMTELFTYGFAFEPRERFCVSFARRQPGVEIRRFADGAEPTTILEDAMVQCLAIDPTGNLLACGCTDGDASSVRLILSADGQERGTVPLPAARDGNGSPGPMSLAFSGNGEVLAIGLSDARVLRVNVSSQEVTETHTFAGVESLGGVSWIG